jgi:histidinol dehydrogenase
MSRIFYATDPDFESQFRALLESKREVSEDVDTAVAGIIADVRTRGDAALIESTQRFDHLTLTPATMRVSAQEIEAAVNACAPETLEALRFAKNRIEAYHIPQKPHDYLTTDTQGVTLGWRWSAVDAVGLYVPGGTASYPSSVLMNAVPAKVAGVERVVMVVPSPHGKLNPVVLVAAHLAGIDEIYRIGGAQAIAALAYGTATIAPVDKIVGPGNAYVAAAKRRVFGQVGIDMIAGPSEVLILADESANASWIAADLLAQAEHDTAAQSLLITDSESLAQAVLKEVERQAKALPRHAIAQKSWQDHGAVMVVASLYAALPLVNRIAAEHLEIHAINAQDLAAQVRHAGAIFIGEHTPEAIGDYVGGSNHVLPTARSARFSSALGVYDYMKRTSILSCTQYALSVLGSKASILAREEALEGHARSVDVRLFSGNEVGIDIRLL